MKKTFAILIICSMMLSSCVRLPDDYAYVIDQGASTNEVLLEKIYNDTNLTVDEKNAFYYEIITEDIKTLRAIAKTIRAGGGD